MIRFLCSVLSTRLATLQGAGGDVDAVIHASVVELLLACTPTCPGPAARCSYSPDGTRVRVSASTGARLLHSRLATHCLARFPRYPQVARDRRPCARFETVPLDVAPMKEIARRVSTAPGAVACPSSDQVAMTARVIQVGQAPSARQDSRRLRRGRVRGAGLCPPGSIDHRPTLADAGPNWLRPAIIRLNA